MKIPQVEEFLIRIQKSWEQATKVMEKAQRRMKKQFNKKRQNLQELKVGDNVWLENKNIHSNLPVKKLNNKRYRSFVRYSSHLRMKVHEVGSDMYRV